MDDDDLNVEPDRIPEDYADFDPELVGRYDTEGQLGHE